MEIKRCAKGHAKVRRPYGWHCPACQLANRHAREERAYAEGARRPKPRGSSDSVPTDLRCKRGHVRVRRPNGQLACPTCANAHKAAKRRLMRAKTCIHAEEPGFEGIISETGIMVCLTCLVREMDAP